MSIPKLMDLSGKVAVVTGGQRGIGKAIAMGLADFGADVVIADIAERSKIEETVSEIKRLRRRSMGIKVDVRVKEEVEQMVDEIMREFGRIDILVNSAGVLGERIPTAELPEEEWDRVMNINLKGMLLCCQAAGRVMTEQGRGKIINIASTYGQVGSRTGGVTSYCVSKGGVIQLTRALALEWAKHRINVNAVSPGYTETEMIATKLADKKVYAQMVSKIPLGRLLKPDDVVGAAVYLASEGSDMVTGATINVDGGYLAE